MAKEQQKNICINSYICHVYITINHFKSLCGKTIQKKRHRAQDRQQKEKRRTSNSSYTPAALQINTNRLFLLFPKTLLRMYKSASVFNTNKTISSKPFKYSTKCTINMEWRCEPGGKIHYLLTCFCCLFF